MIENYNILLKLDQKHSIGNDLATQVNRAKAALEAIPRKTYENLPEKYTGLDESFEGKEKEILRQAMKTIKTSALNFADNVKVTVFNPNKTKEMDQTYDIYGKGITKVCETMQQAYVSGGKWLNELQDDIKAALAEMESVSEEFAAKASGMMDI